MHEHRSGRGLGGHEDVDVAVVEARVDVMPGHIGIVDQARGLGRIRDAARESEKTSRGDSAAWIGRRTCGEHDSLVTELPFHDVDAPLVAQGQLRIRDASRRDDEIDIAAQRTERFLMIHDGHARSSDGAVLGQAADKRQGQRPRQQRRESVTGISLASDSSSSGWRRRAAIARVLSTRAWGVRWLRHTLWAHAVQPTARLAHLHVAARLGCEAAAQRPSRHCR